MKFFLLPTLLILFLSSCATRPVIQTYLQPQKQLYTAPDSVKIEMKLTMEHNGEKNTIKGILFSKPYQAYRLELRGPLGMSVGSLLWMDSTWLFVMPQQELFHNGKGDNFDLQNPALPPSIHFHRSFAPLWGELLPPGWQLAERGGNDSLITLNWTIAGSNTQAWALANGVTGEVQSVKIDEETIQYNEYTHFGKLVLPKSITIFRNQQKILHIELLSVNDTAKWSPKIWTLKAPERFKEL